MLDFGLGRAAVGWVEATGATPAASAQRAAIAGGVTGAEIPSLPRTAGRAHGRCQGKQMERAMARKRRDWRDPWRPVVGRTGRDQARSVRVDVLCLAMGGSTKAAPKRSDARPRTSDQRAASKRPAGLRAAGPRLPRSRGLCAATVCAQSRYCGLAGRTLGGERALLGTGLA